jgi:hypothetical protein
MLPAKELYSEVISDKNLTHSASSKLKDHGYDNVILIRALIPQEQ